jgi:hypothetical protein
MGAVDRLRYELRRCRLRYLAGARRGVAFKDWHRFGFSPKAWRKPAALALSLTGAAVCLAHGNALAAFLFMGSMLLNFSPASTPEAGAYSYPSTPDRFGCTH